MDEFHKMKLLKTSKFRKVHDKMFDNKFMLQLFNYFVILQSLSFGLFNKYFLQLQGLELKVMPVENILIKMIQTHGMKLVPFSATNVLVLAMIKVIIVELEHN